MQNKYAAACYRCGITVAANQGEQERVGRNGWRVQHTSCFERWRGKEPTREEAADAYRRLGQQQDARTDA